MTAEGHLLFSIACAVFAKNAELTPVLAQGDWWHIVPSAILTCLLPDIDHPKSFLGQRLKWISKPIARAFGHRGFTHSLLAVFALLATFYLKVPESWFIPADALQGMVLGYLSHILADMLTPAGVPLLWYHAAGVSACLSWFPKRATNWNVLSAWHYLSGRYGCPIHYPKTALFVGHRK
ncbi:Membrane protein [Escherichia coli]|nr:Membrane protein [Escherichia coli]